MTGLLVSVRNAHEAKAALAGGAALIDVKEPARGPLGRADDAVIAAVVREVAGRVPVSAALGELPAEPPRLPQGLRYLKFGLAGWAGRPWQAALRAIDRRTRNETPGCRVVAAAYVDHVKARSPSVEEVFTFVHGADRLYPDPVFLIDTWVKDGSTLLEWTAEDEVVKLCQRARSVGVGTALAGSLGCAEIERLRRARPDWFAVRGAACKGRQRNAIVEESEVRRLVRLLSEPEA
jgi:uncharacterized protein (UPF0264 family)